MAPKKMHAHIAQFKNRNICKSVGMNSHQFRDLFLLQVANENDAHQLAGQKSAFSYGKGTEQLLSKYIFILSDRFRLLQAVMIHRMCACDMQFWHFQLIHIKTEWQRTTAICVRIPPPQKKGKPWQLNKQMWALKEIANNIWSFFMALRWNFFRQFNFLHLHFSSHSIWANKFFSSLFKISKNIIAWLQWWFGKSATNEIPESLVIVCYCKCALESLKFDIFRQQMCSLAVFECKKVPAENRAR